MEDKKVKVGILSMQRIANYGSFLQAYGLKSILEELGCHVEFVDYHVEAPLIETKEKTGLSRKISKALEVFKYKAPLKESFKFIKYKKNYSKNYYPYLNISHEYNYNPQLDMLVIGSDEVFNCVQDNTNVGYSKELFGYKNNAKRLISYAGSFGNTTLEKIDTYHVREELKDMFSKFDDISVRDSNSVKIIEGLLGEVPNKHLDPVLAYDYIGKCTDIPKSMCDDKYMILYGYSGRFSDAECEYIKKYAKQKGLKVFCIGGIQKVCDQFIDCNPFEVISYFKNADCVVTDTFHGTILSVITQRQFCTLIRKSGYGNSEKLTDLLNCLHLMNRNIDEITALDSVISENIDYESVNKIIRQERENSYNYLKENINKL